MSVDSLPADADEQSVEELVRDLATRVTELEAENEHLQEQLKREREKRKQLEEDIEFLKETVFNLEDVVVGTGYEYQTSTYAEDNPAVLSQLAELSDGESIADLRQDLVNEQKTRSREDSQLRRKVNEVADAAGVDVEDADVTGQDKIQRMIVNGPDDVADRVYKVHERARDVLLHAGDWGHNAQDAYGKRITLKGPKVREMLEAERNESLQSKQVGDVFSKIVELAADSPRKAKTTTNDDGIRVLRIHLDQDGMN